MSVAAASVHNGENPQDEIQKYHAFVLLGIVLAAITGIEIVIIYMYPLSWWLVAGVLLVLSTVKFICVITWFMHLIYDKLFNTILFAIGLTLGGGTAAALIVLHSQDYAFTVEEMEEFKAEYPMPVIVRAVNNANTGSTD